MTDHEELLNYIRGRLSERDILEALAEEASELAQASLKLIRAKGMNDNATPVTKETAYKNLLEEIRDVLAILRVMSFDLEYLIRDLPNYPKWDRWVKRLKESES